MEKIKILINGSGTLEEVIKSLQATVDVLQRLRQTSGKTITATFGDNITKTTINK